MSLQWTYGIVALGLCMMACLVGWAWWELRELRRAIEKHEAFMRDLSPDREDPR